MNILFKVSLLCGFMFSASSEEVPKLLLCVVSMIENVDRPKSTNARVELLSSLLTMINVHILKRFLFKERKHRFVTFYINVLTFFLKYRSQRKFFFIL